VHHITALWHPSRRFKLDPSFEDESLDRRRAMRRPLDLPLRLRLGSEFFPGFADNLSAGGIGLRLVPQSLNDHTLGAALASHERGAIELLLGDIRFVTRVRITRIQPSLDDVTVGAAIDNDEEAERLIRRLEACGI